MTITCFIRYQIDPFQRDAFKTRKFILREQRTFVEAVEGTLGIPPQLQGVTR